MNANSTIDTRPTDDKTLDALMQAVEQYEPTPQEIRWGLVEHHARKVVKLIEDGGVIGMTYEAEMGLAELAGVLGVPFDPKAARDVIRK